MPLPQAPTCVVTGAGSGFGRALAMALAARRGRLVLSDVDLPSVQRVAEAAVASGALSARALRCDVTRIEDVVALAGACEGPIDLVANNAGVSSAGLVGEMSLEDWRWTLETDLMGVVHGCHVFVPRLRSQGHGHLLNVASAAAFACAPKMAAYSVAKAGVVALSETLAVELSGTGVGVTVLCPTFFRSELVKRGRFAKAPDRLGAQWLIDRGKPPEFVVRAALDAVGEDRLYCVPMADGRWLWRLKRAAPERFPAVLRRFVSRRRN